MNVDFDNDVGRRIDGEIDYASLKQTTARGPRYGEGIAEFFAKFGERLPAEMSRQRSELVKRLG